MTQAILQCLPLLADILGRAYGVVVEIGGSDAYTTGRVIRLPSLPAASDPTFLGLVRGYIDHEAAHIRHTDFAAMARETLTPLEKHIWNIFEDWRVEGELAALFPGCRQNFRWLIRHVFLHPPSQPLLPAYAVLNWLLLTVRSWSVAELVSRCRLEGDHLDTHWPGLRPRLEVILSTMNQHCPDSLACLDYARQVIHCLADTATTPKTKEKSGHPPDPGDSETITANTAQAHEGVSPEAPSSVLATDSDLQALIGAADSDLPEDLGQILKRTMGEQTGKLARDCAVATIGEKSLTPLTAADLAEIQKVTAGLKARFHGLLQANKLVRQTPSRQGRIDPRRLHGLAVGSTKVFLTQGRKRAVNTAVHILLDSSSSMRERIGLASQCCHAVAQALSQAGLSVGITAFPGNPTGATGATGGATVVPILRQGDRLTSPLVAEARGLTPLGEALWWVLQRLASVPEQRRIVLILTDGAPDNLLMALEAIRIGETLGMEIYGLGIDAPEIKHLLPTRSGSIDTLAALPAALFSLLEETLLNEQMKDGRKLWK
ncbi:MAG TPA: hypothetical protein VK558_06475 [Patescibacteria group bacterium]|nr:hypothetical protein [Patescibacteria group bacterium]